MDMQEILRKVITSTNEIFEAEAGSVALLEPSGQEIVIRAAVGAGADAVRGLSLPIDKGVIGWVASHETPALIPDVTKDSRFYQDIDKTSGFQTKSILCVPMQANGHTIGVIELMNMRPDYLGAAGLKILSVIADHAALAIENARLLAQTRQQSEEQALLFEAMAIVTSDLALDTVLDAVSRQMVEALKADLCLISRWPPQKDQLDVMQSYIGPDAKRQSPLVRPLDNPSIPISILESQKSALLETNNPHLSAEELNWLEQLGVQVLFLIPLIYRRQTIGLVEIGRLCNEGPVKPNELRLAETMAAQAAVAIEHARLYDEATRRLAEAKVLQEVMVAAASTLDFDQVLSGTIKALHRTLGIERLGFFLPSEDGSHIISHPATIGFHLENGPLHIPMDGSAVGWVIRNGKPALLPNVKEFSHYYELAADTQSEMCVPVLLNNQVAAVLNAESSRLNAFDPEDLRLFRAIAAELAVALENAQLFETEHRLVRQQQALMDVFADLSAELKPEILFQRIIERAIEVIPNADAGSLIVPKDDVFVYAAAVALDMRHLQNLTFDREDFLKYQPGSQKVERLSQQELLELSQKIFPLAFDQYAEATRIHEVKSALRAILRAGEDILGSINIDSRSTLNAFTEEDEQTLLLFAGQAAIAIQNARLFEEIRAAEANYRDLFDNANDFIFTLDSNFRISSANKAILEATGYQLHEIIRMRITNFIEPEQRDRLFKLFKARLASPQAAATFELPVRGKGARKALLEITFRVRRLGQRPVSIHCIARDITQRRELEQQLRQTEKLSTIGKLVAGVAHELNNPLTSIIGYASLLRENDRLQPYQGDLEIIFHQADRARIIVKDLLTFARKFDLDTKPVDINQVLQTSLTLTRPVLQSQNIQVTTSLDFSIPLTLADPHQLEQVFVNLITNAAQALATVTRPRQLTITAKQAKENILLSFADNGPGILPEIANRIFDPFFSTKQVGEGTGLGLSICFGIISEHKGRIWTEDSPGGGATFYIELPIVLVQEPAVISLPVTPSSKRLSTSSPSLQILAIDDEPHLRDLLCRVLNRLGHTVETAPDGEIALQKLEQHYDLIICDVIMPDILGPELYQRAVSKFPRLTKRFIFITGNVVDVDTRIFLEKSDLPWLAKPFLPADLEQAITKAVARVEMS
jgi:two-component system NtrC family sensor kinase